MKYYAVKKGKTPGVYTTWPACSEQVTGYSGAIFKKFTNLEDADAFINGKAGAEKETSAEATDATIPYAYVDGSFNAVTNTYGFGGFLAVEGREYVLQGSGNDPKRSSLRNVAGEIDGCMAAVKKAIELRLPKLYIYYDYRGIAGWATGEWKTRNKWTRAYRDYMAEAMKLIDIKFVKVAGHTGVEGNERADKLAKAAVGIK